MNTAYYLLSKLLRKNNYRLSAEVLKERLFSDPENYVLKITNTIDFFKIENLVATVSKSDLDKLPRYFLAQIKANETYNFVLVEKINDKFLQVAIQEGKTINITHEEFCLEWTGLVIVIEKKQTSWKDYFSLIKKNNFILCLVFLLGLPFFYLINNDQITYFIVSLLGIYLGGLIIKEKYGNQEENSKFCKLSKKSDCLSVINSDSSKVFGIIDLSEITILYFLTISLTYIIEPKSSVYFTSSIASLPFIIYSVFYQFIKIKKWCPLCMSTVLVLLIQFGLQIVNYKEYSINFYDFVLPILLGFSLYGILIQFIAIYKKSVLSNHLTIENLKFKRNYNLFFSYYKTLKLTENIPQSSIKLGSDNPLLSLAVITNPYCKMCRDAHQKYMSLLEKFKDKICVEILFLVPINNTNDPKLFISSKLMAIYNQKPEMFSKAFNTWYATTNIEKWTKEWKEIEYTSYYKDIKEQTYWCLNNEIDATPHFLINGRLIPDVYDINNLDYFIENLLNNNSIDITEPIHA